MTAIELGARPASSIQKARGEAQDLKVIGTHEGAGLAPSHQWTRIGSACRTDSGTIQINLEYGPYPGLYQIDSSDATALLVLREQVPLTVYVPESKHHYLIGSARWSCSGRMLLLDLYGSTRCGTCQIPTAPLIKYYLDEDDRPVDVVVPPEESA